MSADDTLTEFERQQAAMRGIDFSEVLPFPEDVSRQAIKGGITAFVQPQCQMPRRRIMLALAVRGGRSVEGEGTKGFSKLIEHLAFSARSTNLDPTAECDLDATRFTAVIPVADADVSAAAAAAARTSSGASGVLLHASSRTRRSLVQALTLLRDIQRNLVFNADEVDVARVAVIENVRLRHAKRDSFKHRRNLSLARNTGYADILSPESLSDDVESATADQLTAFYRQKYRSELCCICAAGDFSDADAVSILNLIEEIFECDQATAPLIEPPVYRLSPSTKLEPLPDVVIVPSSSKDYSRVHFDFCYDADHSGVSSVRRVYEEVIAAFALLIVQWQVQQHLSASQILLQCDADGENFSRTISKIHLLLSVPIGQELFACQAVAFVLETVKSSLWLSVGDVAEALDHLKTALIASVEANFLDSDNATDKRLDGLCNHFIASDMLLSNDSSCTKSLVSLIGADGAARGARTFMDWDFASICISVARTGSALHLAKVIAAIREGRVMAQQSIAEAVREAELGVFKHESFQLSEIVDRRVLAAEVERPVQVLDDPESSTIEIRLTNGATVMIRSSEQFVGQIEITAEASNGALLEAWANNDGTSPEYFSCAVAATLALNCFNWGGIDAKQMHQLFLRTHASIDATDVSMTDRLVRFTALPSSFENGLQLVHQWFTMPAAEGEWTNDGLRAWVDRHLPEAEGETPGQHQSRLVLKRRYNNLGILRSQTRDMFLQADAEQARRFYQACFSNPADFTFGIVGYLDPEDWPKERVIRLVSQYIGTIPVPVCNAAHTFDEDYHQRSLTELVELLEPTFPNWLIKGYSFDVSFFGSSPVAAVQIALEMPQIDSYTDHWLQQAVVHLVELRMESSLHEYLPNSFKVSVSLQHYLSIMFPGQIVIEFDCPPEKIEELVDLVFDELKLLTVQGASAAERQATVRFLHNTNMLFDNDRDSANQVLTHTSVERLQRLRALEDNSASDDTDAGGEMSMRKRQETVLMHSDRLIASMIFPESRAVIVSLSEDMREQYAHLQEFGDPCEPLRSESEEFEMSPDESASGSGSWVLLGSTFLALLGIVGATARFLTTSR